MYGRRMARFSSEIVGLHIREMDVRFFMLSVFDVIKEPHMISKVQCFKW